MEMAKQEKECKSDQRFKILNYENGGNISLNDKILSHYSVHLKFI